MILGGEGWKGGADVRWEVKEIEDGKRKGTFLDWKYNA